MLVRRTQLKRTAFARRLTPLRQISPERRARKAHDTEYMLWVKTLCCCAPVHCCRGVVQAHHAGKRPGMRLKAPDDTCIPLCPQAHRDLHSQAGPFREMTGSELRQWQNARIEETQAAWARHILLKKTAGKDQQ